MQRTPIEWVKNKDGVQGYTWNPLTGCEHECPYCFARWIARRFGKTKEEKDFKPVFRPERLNEPQKIKKSSMVLVCSMADLFGEWVPEEWIEAILLACGEAPQHRYIFLTKNPERYLKIDFNHKTWWPLTHLKGMSSEGHLSSAPILVDFISFEPLLQEPATLPVLMQSMSSLRWIIVGAQTGPGAKAHQPKKEWVEDIIKACEDTNTSLFLKDNLLKIYPALPRIQNELS